jgi:DNA-binding HxlR family transcriptional regulator/putative sterol carrier protein
VGRRSYNQYCALARALDVVGERWTLLLVRELLLGPKRYKDLLGGLPGIGTNLLADRLRELEHVGLVQRAVLPPPAGSTVYELTDLGRALEPTVFALGRWGAHFLEPRKRSDSTDPGWFFVSIRATFRSDRAAHLRESYEFWIDGTPFHASVDRGRARTRQGPADDPVVVVTTDLDSFIGLLSQKLSPRRAVASGRVGLEGDKRALKRFVEIFAWPSPQAVATPLVRSYRS